MIAGATRNGGGDTGYELIEPVMPVLYGPVTSSPPPPSPYTPPPAPTAGGAAPPVTDKACGECRRTTGAPLPGTPTTAPTTPAPTPTLTPVTKPSAAIPWWVWALLALALIGNKQ